MSRNNETVKKSKSLQNLTMKDNFMFGAVMSEPENCKGFLEMVLGISIDRVEIDVERSMIYNPEYKGIRLDVYAKDEHNTHYNVEMQAQRETELGRRSRYYHSQIDMELLVKGEEYEKLSDSYIIFICDFDPFKQKKYCYTFESICKETKEAELKEGRYTIILSTRGENENEVPKEMVKFLKFIKADVSTCMEDFEDEFVARLQKSMQTIKTDREMEGRYMRLELLLYDERRKAKEEGRREGRECVSNILYDVLAQKGNICETLRERIEGETNIEILGKWLQKAIESDSLEEFISQMDK